VLASFVFEFRFNQGRELMNKAFRIFFLLVVVIGYSTGLCRADEVTDWNRIMLDALRTGGATGVTATRPAAIVQSAVFDAVNGIERRYQPIRVPPAAAPGASRRAAAVQAAYATLVKLFPAQKTDLDAKRAASLAGIASEEAVEHSKSIARGIEWGQEVADAIWAWRSTDGFFAVRSPYIGATAPGQWRPTPPANAPMAALNFAFMSTWIINSSFQFPLPGQPAMTSAKYLADFDEVKSLGSSSSTARTADQTLAARFWASASSPNQFWNAVALTLSAQRNLTLSENARLLAMMNIAIADAGISVWTAKYNYNFWRPITAINLADTDGNPSTVPDTSWIPLITTPPYPDYPSGLIGTSAGGVAVLANFFGWNTPITVPTDSTAAGLAGLTRSFTDFASALEELVGARIWSGIHFRTADEDARQLGISIGNYIFNNAFQRH
jgi:hypothetical protein